MAKSSIWTKNFILALCASFLVNISYHMLNSTIGIYAKGFTNVELLIGLTASGFTGAALLTKLGTASLLERVPLKKVLLIGLGCSFVTATGYLLANNIYLLIAIRVLHGLAYGFVGVSISTIVSSSLPRVHLLEGLGYNMMLTTLTTAIGPAIVLNLTHSEIGRFVYAFVLLLAVLALAFLVTLPINSSQNASTNTDCVGRLELTLATWFPAIMAMLVGAAQSGVVVYINLYALEKSFGNMTPYFFCFAISNFVTRFVMNKLTDYISERQFLYFAGFGGIVTMIGIYLAKTAYVIFGLGILFGMAMGVFYPIISSQIIKSLSWRKQGLANSVNAATMDGANILGITIWSALATHFGTYAYIYPVAAMLLVIYLVVLTVYPAILDKMGIAEESEC